MPGLRPTDLSPAEIRQLERLARGRQLAQTELSGRLCVEFRRQAAAASVPSRLTLALAPTLGYLLSLLALYATPMAGTLDRTMLERGLLVATLLPMLLVALLWRYRASPWIDTLTVVASAVFTLFGQWARQHAIELGFAVNPALVMAIPVTVLALGRLPMLHSLLVVAAYALIRLAGADDSGTSRWMMDIPAEAICLAALLASRYWSLRLQQRQFASSLLLAVLAACDPLTDLPNRRTFEQHYRLASLALGRSRRRCLTLAIVDVDHFKRFNDHYGHGRGDQVLQQLATLMTAIPEQRLDMAARLGGEEFAVLLHDCDAAAARQRLTRFLDELGRQAIPHAASPLGRLSVSIGAVVVGRGMAWSDAYQSADQQLYAAKAAGRNRCCVIGSPSLLPAPADAPRPPDA